MTEMTDKYGFPICNSCGEDLAVDDVLLIYHCLNCGINFRENGFKEFMELMVR